MPNNKDFKLIGKRLFTFGCSITSYNYPTWADILGYHYPFYENWGKPGKGNSFVLSSIIECDKRHNFTPEDDIIIMWSSSDRFDFYQFETWSSKHQAFPHNDPFSCCPDGYELLSTVYKISAHSHLSLKNLNFKSFSWVSPLDGKVSQFFSKELADIKYVTLQCNNKKTKNTSYNAYQDFLIELYKTHAGPDWPTLTQILNSKYECTNLYILKELEEFKERITYDSDWNFDEMVLDAHPLPLQHLNFVKEYFPKFIISDDCSHWINDIQTQIESGTYNGFKSSAPKVRF